MDDMKMDINKFNFDFRPHLTRKQWEQFFHNTLVPEAECSARAMNNALELLVKGNRDGYTLRMEGEQVKRVAEIMAYELVDNYDLDGDRMRTYTGRLVWMYPKIIASMLDRHAIVGNGINRSIGELDLF